MKEFRRDSKTPVREKQEQTREIRGERDYNGFLRARVVLSDWPSHPPRRSAGETSVRNPL